MAWNNVAPRKRRQTFHTDRRREVTHKKNSESRRRIRRLLESRQTHMLVQSYSAPWFLVQLLLGKKLVNYLAPSLIKTQGCRRFEQRKSIPSPPALFTPHLLKKQRCRER